MDKVASRIRLQRIDSQTTICKIFYPIKSIPFVALQGRPLQSATIGYAITSNPVRPTFFIELEQLLIRNS